MCSGERPMGAATGKQPNTMASCQTPPPEGPKDSADQASFIRGGGVFWTRPTHPTLDPPTQLLTHPDPPPPLIILWGAFFVNQIEAKALSRVRHPQRVTHQKLHNTRV